MAFKLIKIVAIATIGMMLAPKKGSELRADFVKLIKKYNPQLRKLVDKIEIIWEKSQGNESDEVVADIELRIQNVKGAVEILEATSSKEMAYRTLKKIDNNVVKLVKAGSKSPNLRAVFKELAKTTVEIVDASVVGIETIKNTSISISEKIIDEGRNQQKDFRKKVKSSEKPNK